MDIRLGEDKDNPYAIYDRLGVPYPLPLIKSDKPTDIKHVIIKNIILLLFSVLYTVIQIHYQVLNI